MAFDKSVLQKFLANPANVSPEDLEDDQEVLPEESLQDEEVPVELEEPEFEEEIAEPAKEEIPEDMPEEQTSEIASDMKAPIELRRQALLRIKQKYLGQ